MVDNEEHAAIVETIASDVLPKLVELLQEILPEYRKRTIDAAMILVDSSDNGGCSGG